MNNKAVLKALFKNNVDEITFNKVIKVTIEIEDAAKDRRVCGDYSTSANPLLEIHRHRLLSPKNLMQKLDGGNMDLQKSI